MGSSSSDEQGKPGSGRGGIIARLAELFALAACAHWPSAASVEVMESILARRQREHDRRASGEYGLVDAANGAGAGARAEPRDDPVDVD